MIPSRSVSSRYCVIFSLALCLAGRLNAADALVESLQNFESKLDAVAVSNVEKNSNTQQGTPKLRTGVDGDDTDQRKLLMMQMLAQRFSEQLKSVKTAIARKDYERATSQLNNLSGSGLPPELAKTWYELAAKVAGELEARQTQELKAWGAQIEECVRATKETCLKAKTSGDLDALLVQVAALQLSRPTNSNDIVAQRASQRLGSVANTLESWMKYLDFKTAGNTKAANYALRTLANNDSQIPVLSVADITARIVEEQANYEMAMIQIYVGIKTPDDIASALTKIAGLGKAPDGDMILNNERRFLELLQQAGQAFEKGDTALSLKVLSSGRNIGGIANLTPYRERLLSMFDGALRRTVLQKASNISPVADEALPDYEKRVLDTLYGKEDFETLGAVMAVADDLATAKKSYVETRATLQRFQAARRFEAANDPAFAVTEYRRVLRSNGGDYVPMQQAGEALKRLQAAHPELFNPSDSRILAEVEGLRQDVLQLISRSSGMPPGFPVRR